jgi:hypothetical protein
MQYRCNTCQNTIEGRPSQINQQLKAHAGTCQHKSMNHKLYPHSDFSYIPPVQLFMVDVFNYADAINYRNTTVLPLLQALNGGEKGKIPDSKYSDAKGGVKKKFFPNQAIVVAGDKKTASGDYDKEDQVFARAGGIVKDPNRYLSFQIELEDQDDDNARITIFRDVNREEGLGNIRKNQMRRVSVYGGFDDRGTRNNNQYYCTLESFIGSDQHNPSASELVSAIHQVIKIHEFLYLKKIKHGDMHMGNIKVIRVDEGILVKAFDFGKAKIKAPEKNYTRDDLRYLILKKAIGSSSGVVNHFETKSREKRGEDHDRQLKHYPLHKITKFLIQHYDLPQVNNKEIFTKNIHERIQLYGNQLLDNLQSARATGQPGYEAIQLNAIINMFELFSNQLVCALYGTG